MELGSKEAFIHMKGENGTAKEARSEKYKRCGHISPGLTLYIRILITGLTFFY